jgi:hypothetical protein
MPGQYIKHRKEKWYPRDHSGWRDLRCPALYDRSFGPSADNNGPSDGACCSDWSGSAGWPRPMAARHFFKGPHRTPPRRAVGDRLAWSSPEARRGPQSCPLSGCDLRNSSGSVASAARERRASGMALRRFDVGGISPKTRHPKQISVYMKGRTDHEQERTS